LDTISPDSQANKSAGICTANDESISTSEGESRNFVIAWSKRKNIYFQQYSSYGIPLGNKFKVNDD
jgi:hypothetical protein